MTKYIGFSCIALCLLLCIPAKAVGPCTSTAGNLVANCGFETGDFTSWTLSGNDVPSELNNLYGVEGTDPIDGISPNSGSFQAYFGDLVANSTTLSQSIATTASDLYTVSFYLAQDTSIVAPYSNAISASFGGVTLTNLTGIPIEGYTDYTFNVAASSSSSLLSLDFGNDLGEFLVDDITVVQSSAPPPQTPEPPAWTLVLLGTIGSAFFWKRGMLAAN